MCEHPLGTQVIELAKGKFSIEVEDEQTLIVALEAVKRAVEVGELDPQINVATKCLNVTWYDLM